ncbi:MAG TPA: HAD-IB family hydrolase [Acidimicrobiales bacterium]
MQAAFFDLDKTVIAKASMVAFGRPLHREGLLSRWLLLRALWGQLVYLYLGADETKLHKMRDAVLRLTKGWPEARIRALVVETLEEVFEPIVFDEALQLIADHRRKGHKVFLLSASPIEIVEPLGDWLGVDESLGTRAMVGPDGRYTGEVKLYCYGPVKAQVMREVAARDGIELGDSFAYSDSETDIPMLEAVGHPVAVNPDRELQRVAKERAWEVRWFVRPVRLRDRINLPSPKATAAVGGGLSAMAAAGAAVLWWLRREPPSPPTRRERAVAVATGGRRGRR